MHWKGKGLMESGGLLTRRSSNTGASFERDDERMICDRTHVQDGHEGTENTSGPYVLPELPEA